MLPYNRGLHPLNSVFPCPTQFVRFFSPKRKSVRSRSIRRARFGFQFYCLQLRTDVLVHKIAAPQGMVTKELIPDSRAARLWTRALWSGHPFWRHQLLYFSEAKKNRTNYMESSLPNDGISLFLVRKTWLVGNPHTCMEEMRMNGFLKR